MQHQPFYPCLSDLMTEINQYVCAQTSQVIPLELTVRIASATAKTYEYTLGFSKDGRRTSCRHDVSISYGHRLLLILASLSAKAFHGLGTERHTLKALLPEFDCGNAVAAILSGQVTLLLSSFKYSCRACKIRIAQSRE